MNRENFVIDQIPDGYKVYDVDLSPSGRSIAILGHASEEGPPAYVRLPGGRIDLPEGAVWRHPATDELVCRWMTRWVGDERVLTAVPRCRSNEQTNAWIWNEAAEPLAEFHAGDGIEDILADERRIIVTYFDEGVFSSIDPGHEGLAFFDTSGRIVGGYMSSFGADAIHIYDCYCACWVDSEHIIFFPYAEPNFPLVRLNVDRMSQEVWSSPESLHGSHALTSAGETVYFHSPYTSTGLRDKFLAWSLGSTEFVVVGAHPTSHRIRGLPGGRFLSQTPGGYTIISFDE